MAVNDHNSVYHRRMAVLQEKLRQSEEERHKLEEKFSVMMKACKEEEEERLSLLKMQYETFLEEDKKRRDRNDTIMRSLDKIESRAATLNAKSKRLKLLREHYEAYLMRVYPTWKSKGSLPNSPRTDHTLQMPVNKTDNFLDGSSAGNYKIPFTSSRRSSVSLSDVLVPSPRLTEATYSVNNADYITAPKSLFRHQEDIYNSKLNDTWKISGTMSRRPSMGTGPFLGQTSTVPHADLKTRLDQVHKLNSSSSLLNGYSDYRRTSVSGIDTANVYDQLQSQSERKSEFWSPKKESHQLRTKNLADNANMSHVDRDSVIDAYEREIKTMPPGVSGFSPWVDNEWEQNTSRDLLNMSLSDDGKAINPPTAEELKNQKRNLHLPMTDKVEEDHFNNIPGLGMVGHFSEKNENQEKEHRADNVLEDHVYHDVRANENKMRSPHEIYAEEDHSEIIGMESMNAENNNSTNDYSVEIGREIERALSAEKGQFSEGAEKQRNLEIILEENNSAEEPHEDNLHLKSISDKGHDFLGDDSESLSGAVLTDADSEQTSLPQEQPAGVKLGSKDLADFDGSKQYISQATSDINIIAKEGEIAKIQQEPNVYDIVETNAQDNIQVEQDDLNGNMVHVDQDMQQFPNQHTSPSNPLNQQDMNYHDDFQQSETVEVNQAETEFDNSQAQNYTYSTVESNLGHYNELQGTENFYEQPYEQEYPNYDQGLQPNEVAHQSNGSFNEMFFQDATVPNGSQPAFPAYNENFGTDQGMLVDHMMTGELLYDQNTPRQEDQFYNSTLEQQSAYIQDPAEHQYVYSEETQNQFEEQQLEGEQQFVYTNNLATYQPSDQNPTSSPGESGISYDKSPEKEKLVSDILVQEQFQNPERNPEELWNKPHGNIVENIEQQDLSEQNIHGLNYNATIEPHSSNQSEHATRVSPISELEVFQEPKETELTYNQNVTQEDGQNGQSGLPMVFTEVDRNIESQKCPETVPDKIPMEMKADSDSDIARDLPLKEQQEFDQKEYKEAVYSEETLKINKVKEDNSMEHTDSIKDISNKEQSDIDLSSSAQEDVVTESIDGGKYHEPTVGYESAPTGYSMNPESSTTEDSSERWTTMPKKSRQQVAFKVQNKKAETPPLLDEESSDESQVQPALNVVNVTSNVDTSDDSDPLGNKAAHEVQNVKSGLNTASTVAGNKLGRTTTRGSSKLPALSTPLDSDDSLHLGSESSAS